MAKLKPAATAQTQNNVITPQTMRAMGGPAFSGQVQSSRRAQNDKVRLAPIDGGIGFVTTRAHAEKTIRTNPTLVIKEI